MQGFLEVLKQISSFLLSLNSAVLIPIFLFLLAIVLGAKPGRAIKSALTVGVGFVGIATITTLFFTKLAPIAEQLVTRTNLSLNVIDVGWGPFMGAIWALPIALLFLPIFLVINIILLFVKFTKTIDIDLWNYALCFYSGMFVYVTSDHNVWLSLLAFALSEILVLKLADWLAPMTQEFFGLEGISFPHVVSVAFVPIGWALNKLLDMIPGISKLQADPETLRKKFGVFGEPVFMGFAIGFLIAIFSGVGIGPSLELGVTMGGVMLLLPRMVSILVEGLTPLSEVIRTSLQKVMPGRDIYIGLDTAITIGHESTIAASIVLVPIALLLAAILPYNRVIPFADLASIAFAICLITPLVKGNVVKLIIIGTVIIALVMLPVSGWVAPEITAIVKEADMFALPEQFGTATMVTAFLDGSNPISFIIYKLIALFY